MKVVISIYQLEIFLRNAAELGARNALSEAGKLRPYLKKSEAFRLYGRRSVEHWIKEGLVTPRKDGNHSASWRLEWLELESIKRARELICFLEDIPCR